MSDTFRFPCFDIETILLKIADIIKNDQKEKGKDFVSVGEMKQIERFFRHTAEKL